MKVKKCLINDCNKPQFCRGWCAGHYSRWQRRGTTDKHIPENTKNCKYPGCVFKQKSKGLCNTHAMKFRRTGTLERLVFNDEWKRKQSEAQRSSLSKIDPFRHRSERGYHAVNIVNDIKYKARQRGKEWSLTNEQAYNFIIDKCRYCGHKPQWPNERNGIDRFENEKGYTIENCVSCCFSCNSAKGTRSFNEFRDWIIKVYQNLN